MTKALQKAQAAVDAAAELMKKAKAENRAEFRHRYAALCNEFGLHVGVAPRDHAEDGDDIAIYELSMPLTVEMVPE